MSQLFFDNALEMIRLDIKRLEKKDENVLPPPPTLSPPNVTPTTNFPPNLKALKNLKINYNASVDSLREALSLPLQQSLINIKPSSLNLSNRIINGKSVYQEAVKELEKLNQDKNILYISELLEQPDAERINKKITETVEKYGFERPSDSEYVYKGIDPAAALINLLDTRPLVLDCGTSLSLVNYKTLLNSIGNENFNQYIRLAKNGVLDIRKGRHKHLPSQSTCYYSASHEQNETVLPANLKNGDQLYIQGPAHGFAFHPASDTNGYNVLVKKSNTGAPSLVGFGLEETATHGCWTYDELKSLLLKAYQAPLTLQDVSILLCNRHNDSPAPYSSYSTKSAYDWLKSTQPKALEESEILIRSGKFNPNQSTQLYPPSSDTIRGVVQHDQFYSLSFEQAISHPGNLTAIAVNPEIAPNKQFEQWIPGFKTDLPHEKQIHAAVDAFYESCTPPNSLPKFGGMILYGNPGTGKTMACQALVDRLEQEGHRIWKTDFSENEELLTVKEMQALLEIFNTQGHDKYLEAITEKFKPLWDKSDIIFIDDTNNQYDSLAGVSNAAVRYARKTGKKIIITSNNDPAKAFIGSITFPIDSISIRHIEGPDHRKQNAWYLKNNIFSKNYPNPNQINNFPASENQKHIHQWLHALDDHPGHNGVAFYGAPGIGKTTALKTYFADKKINPLWIESHNLYKNIDLKQTLAASDSEYLIIDDCNDIKSNFQYKNLLFSLLNNETLFNKNGQPIKTILISNRNHWQDLVNDAIDLNWNLSPRMISRYHGRFQSIALNPSEEFRSKSPKAGVICKFGETSIPANVYSFSLKDFFEEKSKRYDIYNKAPASSTANGLKIIFPLGMQKIHDDAFKSFSDLDGQFLKSIDNDYGVAIDMRGVSEISWPYQFQELIKQALDVMEAKPGYHVTIISDNPSETEKIIKDAMKKNDETGKYLSRLQRLWVTAADNNLD